MTDNNNDKPMSNKEYFGVLYTITLFFSSVFYLIYSINSSCQ